jgi:trehalose/maltose hydrolase-like predicted phosphorylase
LYGIEVELMTSRGVTDVVHKVVAVGSRDVRKAQEFVDVVLAGDKAIKAGTYEDVYADEVSCSHI